MSESDARSIQAIVERIRAQADAEEVRLTLHAQQGMAAEDIRMDDVLEALRAPDVLENYPGHQRGACCLVHGQTSEGRHLHVVCTSTQPSLIIITVYEPKPPKWVSPTQRKSKS